METYYHGAKRHDAVHDDRAAVFRGGFIQNEKQVLTKRRDRDTMNLRQYLKFCGRGVSDELFDKSKKSSDQNA